MMGRRKRRWFVDYNVCLELMRLQQQLLLLLDEKM